MSIMFLCGKFGCMATEFDDKAVEKANQQVENWSRLRKKQTGQFPKSEEQEEFWMTCYERLTNIKIAGPRCSECGQLLPDTEEIPK